MRRLRSFRRQDCQKKEKSRTQVNRSIWNSLLPKWDCSILDEHKLTKRFSLSLLEVVSKENLNSNFEEKSIAKTDTKTKSMISWDIPLSSHAWFIKKEKF